MKGMLLALGLALLPATALAQPPSKGTTHTFIDPIFASTVFCDTYFEVLAIATAADPAEVYADFMARRNYKNEPVCAAIVPTGYIVDIRELGIMLRDGKRFDAWAIETRVGDTTGFALYLEQRQDIVA
jgi:hypothetical protein